MPLESQLIDVFVCDCNARFILVGIKNRSYFETSSCARAANEINDGLIVDQRLSLPVQTDEGKQPVFDLVPLAGSGWIVADRDRHAGLVAQRLEMQFPRAWPASVAASAVSADEQPPRSAAVAFSVQPPPAANTFHGEFGG